LDILNKDNVYFYWFSQSGWILAPSMKVISHIAAMPVNRRRRVLVVLAWNINDGRSEFN
jgi:hypothetical protein